MQQDAIDTASQAMEKFNIEKDIAAYIKKECACTAAPRPRLRAAAALPSLPHPPPLNFSTRTWRAVDKKHGPTWHVVVGRNFGSYVTHEVRRLLLRAARHPCARLPPPPACSPLSCTRARATPPVAQTKHFIYFYLGQIAVLCFKSG